MQTVPGVVGSVRGGWRLLADDPFGLLLPTGAMLLLDAAIATVVRGSPLGWRGVMIAAGVAFVARPVLHAPFVARLVAVAARSSGRLAWPFGRPLALLSAEAAVVPITGAAFGIPMAVGALLGGLSANEGFVATGAALLAVGAAVGATFALLVRAVFARLAWAVAVEGRSAVEALGAAVSEAPRHAPVAAVLLMGSDVLLGLCGLACGALLLPGYPLVWLALVHRWSAEAETP